MQETDSNTADDPDTTDDDVSADKALNESFSTDATDSALEQGLEASDSEQPQAELEQMADRILRLQAEMENLRSRMSREIAETRRYAALPLMRDLLPVVDNMARAMEAVPGAQSVESLLEGFKLVKQQLLGALAQHQCTEIAALGEPFDPNIHEAIQQSPAEDIPAQSVCLVTQNGYQLHDRVIRPSQVIVSTGPGAEPDDR